MKRRMIGAWMALMITASSLVVSASPAADMSSVSADPQQEQTEPEEEEEAPDIPVTDQPGEAEMPVPTALPEPETVEEAFEEGKDTTENTDSDELIEPEEEPEAVSKEGENIALTEIPEQTEDPGFTVFTEENAEILTGESEEDQELIQDIENGEIIALSAALPGEFREAGSAEVISEGEDAIAATALSPSQYYLDSWTRVYCDEIWTAANDFLGSGNKTRMGCTYRSVHYIDDTGEEKVSPLYCLKATQDGLDSMTLKNEAVKALTNSVIQKLLYFGYGGPGDLGTGYDPSCSHIDWSKWQNRYVFTHIALSKVYFNDCGYATAAEVEHTGINRLIDKIQTLTIPARNKAAVYVSEDGSWAAASGKTIPLSVFRSRPAGFPFVPDSMKDGFQMSTLMKVTDGAKAGNGITITRGSAEKWQLAYWTSAADYNSHKTNPKMMSGTSLSLKDGAYFFLIFPLNASATKKFSCKMLLQPVSYILVDGSAQVGKDGVQDFGAYVYQGTRGSLSFSVKPSVYGNAKLVKKEPNTGKLIQGAQYGLFAAEALTSGYRTMYSKDQKVSTGTTNASGEILFSKLVPGKYYVKETKAAAGYKLNTAIKNVTVTGGKTTTVSVTDIMDISGTVSIRKKDGNTGDPLAGAEFTLYQWSKKSKAYVTLKKLTYDGQKRTYNSGKFNYTEDNQGKFRVRETKSPPNYTGNWQKNFTLDKPGEKQEFLFEAVNYQTEKRRIEVRKIDAKTGEILKGAEFTLYEYSAAKKAYKEKGTLLDYDISSELYVSGELLKTSDNEGKYKIAETKTPPGYTGSWEEEVNITDKDARLSFEVVNEKEKEYKGVIRLRKTDIYTGEVLEDAEFTVLQWNRGKQTYQNDPGGQSILKFDGETGWYSTEELVLTDDNQGRFKVVETKNPENYTGKYEKEVIFQKKENTDTDIVDLKAENTPVTLPLGSITIIKKIKEEDITWAHGNPTFSFVAEGTDLSGNPHRYEDYVTFTRGSYETDKNGYATLSVTLRNIPLGQYTVWEKPVLRYYLKDVRANTENVRIIKGAAPAYGTDPRKIASGTAALTMQNKNASLTFVNEKSRYDRYSHNDSIKNTIPVSFS